jgi:prolyl 4-hydroxylase
LSQQQGMHPSTLFAGGGGDGLAPPQQQEDLSTRSSTNAWLPRAASNVTETIYRKAALAMQMDPELFQKFHNDDARHHSIAESLQVVHYKKGGEEYQPHHDFVYPSISNRHQPTRFATLLMYLNTVPDGGGETRFPRAANRDFAEGIQIQPVQGRAVLFYNMLPDGNVDDLSQHGSNPTSSSHEKWLANLWVWDPVIG